MWIYCNRQLLFLLKLVHHVTSCLILKSLSSPWHCNTFLKIYYLKIYLNIVNLIKLVYTFQKLQLLYAEDWDWVSVILVRSLLSLEKLDINYGEGLQEVFNVEGLFNRGVQQNVLAIKIKYTWKGSAEHLNLKNFESLRVFGCMKLITIFSHLSSELTQFEIY